ncbi:MAG: hypothetical protein LBP54_05815 [Campylobacteraceae bacterium]|nr:hypothetical protein [Campylobacteraceae bacterium]
MEEQHSKLRAHLTHEGKNAELKHSGLGIASFILSVINIVSIFVLFVIAGALNVSGEEDEATDVIIGAFFLFFMLTTIISIGLGIAGLVVKDRKRMFAALGLIFSVVIFLLSIFLIIVGLYMISDAYSY